MNESNINLFIFKNFEVKDSGKFLKPLSKSSIAFCKAQSKAKPRKARVSKKKWIPHRIVQKLWHN